MFRIISKRRYDELRKYEVLNLRAQWAHRFFSEFDFIFEKMWAFILDDEGNARDAYRSCVLAFRKFREDIVKANLP